MSPEAWPRILLSKQRVASLSSPAVLSVKAVTSSPQAPGARKRSRHRSAESASPDYTEAAPEEATRARRLRPRRSVRRDEVDVTDDADADEAMRDEGKAEDAKERREEAAVDCVSDDELRALMADEDAEPALSASSLLLSSLSSFSSSFTQSLSSLTASLNAQIADHVRQQRERAAATAAAAAVELAREEGRRMGEEEGRKAGKEDAQRQWQDTGERWSTECQRMREEVEAIHDTMRQLKEERERDEEKRSASTSSGRPSEAEEAQGRMDLCIAYYREKERAMKERERKLGAREKELKEREEKTDVKVLLVQAERRKEADDFREKLARMRADADLERTKERRERKEAKERMEELKLQRMIADSDLVKQRTRINELTETVAILERRIKAGGGAGGRPGEGEREEKVGAGVADGVKVEREKEERQKDKDKYVADIEEYVRKQGVELKELREQQRRLREDVGKKDEETAAERTKVEAEERRRKEVEERWALAEKDKEELRRRLAQLQAERDRAMEQLTALQVAAAAVAAAHPLPVAAPQPALSAAPPTLHLVHPSRAGVVQGSGSSAASHPAAHPPAGPSFPFAPPSQEPPMAAHVRVLIERLEAEKREAQSKALADEQQRAERERLEAVERQQRERAEQQQERFERAERERLERERREHLEREEAALMARHHEALQQQQQQQQMQMHAQHGWPSAVPSSAPLPGSSGAITADILTLFRAGVRPSQIASLSAPAVQPQPAAGWKSVKVTAKVDPPSMSGPSPAAGQKTGGKAVAKGDRVCFFFNGPRGCKLGDRCDYLHIPGQKKGEGGHGHGGGGGRYDDHMPPLIR